MAIHFVETMRGHLVDLTSGVQSAASFHLEATRRRGNEFGVEGVAQLPPWADEAPLTGTFTLGLTRLSYALEFEQQGVSYTLAGCKHPSPLRPLASLTQVTLTLASQGTPLAQGAFVFDLFDLPRFAWSWLPSDTRDHRRIRVRHQSVVRARLDSAQQERRS